MARLLQVGSAYVRGVGGVQLSIPDAPGGVGEIFYTLQNVYTTANTTAGSNVVTLTSTTGFAVGSQIVIEDPCVRGTLGVGGSWPPREYPTTAELFADQGQVKYTMAWARDTGYVYQFDTSVAGDWWQLPTSDAALYHYHLAVPKSLVATILEIDGTTVTLDKKARTSLTGAVCYLDETPLIQDAVDKTPINGTLNVDGEGWQSSLVRVEAMKRIWGDGRTLTKFMSPKGTMGAGILGANGVPLYGRDFRIIGNGRPEGYGFQLESKAPPSGYAVLTVHMSQNYATGGELQDIDFVNPNQQAANAAYSNSQIFRRLRCFLDEGKPAYTQWMFTFSDCSSGEMSHIETDCDELHAGIECFRSNDVNVHDCTTRNGLYSSNANGNWTYTNNSVLIEQDSRGNSHVATTQCLSVSKNVDPPASKFTSHGGVVTNMNMVIEGPTFGDGTETYDGGRPFGIRVDSPCVKVGIVGGSYDCSAFDMPARAIRHDANEGYVNDFSVNGRDAKTFHTGQGANIYIVNGPAVNCTVTDPFAVGTPNTSIDAKATGSSGNSAQYINLRA